MVRRVFFSFHYERDKWRVNPVRNAWVTQGREAAGFEDAADWEEVKKQSEEEIKSWIDDQLHGTSVTAVLIGNETAGRKYVNYETKESVRQGNGIIGIKIHRLEDKDDGQDFQGSNPLNDFVIETKDGVKKLSNVFETYEWKRDDGWENIGGWVEDAKQQADQFAEKEKKSVRGITSGEKFVKALQAAGKIGGVVGGGYLLYKWLQNANNDSTSVQNQNGPELPNNSKQNLGDIDVESLGEDLANSGIDLIDQDDDDNDGLI
jgi:uncharacterized membrane protein YebE (DUF533 family)